MNTLITRNNLIMLGFAFLLCACDAAPDDDPKTPDYSKSAQVGNHDYKAGRTTENKSKNKAATVTTQNNHSI